MKLKGLILIVLICLLLPLVAFSTGDKKMEMQKIEVTYKITFNAITFEEAAEKEREIRERYSDACRISASVKDVETYFTLSSSSSINGEVIIWHDDGTGGGE